MKRRIIKIDRNKCNGCGLCVDACHEGAIGLVDGKAQLLREDYCDGLGDCLPSCPVEAITFEEREAKAYDVEAVKQAKSKSLPCGCPGTLAKELKAKTEPCSCKSEIKYESELRQWPVQIKLVPVNAPYFENADLLIAADCTAYAYASFHQDFIKGRITLVGCPKLDSVDYSEKLTEILRENNINSIRVVRMEVPCCGGIEYAVKNAIQQSKKNIPLAITTISTDGNILN